MRRPALPIFALCAALLLAACGGDDDGKEASDPERSRFCEIARDIRAEFDAFDMTDEAQVERIRDGMRRLQSTAPAEVGDALAIQVSQLEALLKGDATGVVHPTEDAVEAERELTEYFRDECGIEPAESGGPATGTVVAPGVTTVPEPGTATTSP
jgi:hypothetical protein